METNTSPRTDKCDQKSLHVLMDKIATLIPEKQSETKSNDRIRFGIKQKLTSSPESETKENVGNWLSKSTAKKQQTELIKKKNSNIKKAKSKTREESKALYQKYGVNVPSYQKIIKDQKFFQKQKKLVESLDIVSPLPKLSFKINLEKTNNEAEPLSCKHLSNYEIKNIFEDFVDVLKEIKDKKRFSKRHNSYHEKSKNGENLVADAGRALIVFTDEQIDFITTLIRSELDPDNEMTGYVFGVLVPECCEFIFMTEHKMEKDEAEKYLDKRPC